MAADTVRICMQPDDLSLETWLELDGVLERPRCCQITEFCELLVHCDKIWGWVGGDGGWN